MFISYIKCVLHRKRLEQTVFTLPPPIGLFVNPMYQFLILKICFLKNQQICKIWYMWEQRWFYLKDCCFKKWLFSSVPVSGALPSDPEWEHRSGNNSANHPGHPADWRDLHVLFKVSTYLNYLCVDARVSQCIALVESVQIICRSVYMLADQDYVHWKGSFSQSVLFPVVFLCSWSRLRFLQQTDGNLTDIFISMLGVWLNHCR